ncbi:transporter substrate-binding domain-containing protein [Pseudoalteromonas sp. JBTF-M23]|uniref:Transporter substrate-binding domain-containing protein n=1 Tax=Pseudoalteromonas caenipelagi TaxID=2726988 RepID=A0A849VH36_9GAMM|nr:transporter substrate-binding domain-containing protein [Pseudoalteromonas caenipelagi]NOU51174.1 transporter substrate-binding domain-containing protein [Pseudoalteromonas caenipelagi]
MQQYLCRILLCCFFLHSASVLANDPKSKIHIYTEDFPPYQEFMGPGKIGGVATKLVKSIFEHSNINYKIHVLPWFRTNHIVNHTPNTFIYSLARTKEREKLYHWIAPLCEINVSFYKLKARKDITVNSIEDIKKYIVAVASGQPTEQHLVEQGFTQDDNLVILASHQQGALMLNKERVDLLFGADLFIKNIEKSMGRIGEWESVYVSTELSKRMYLAANINSDEALISKLRKSHNALSNKLKTSARCKEALHSY